jgi:hypothetical protein
VQSGFLIGLENANKDVGYKDVVVLLNKPILLALQLLLAEQAHSLTADMSGWNIGEKIR